MNAWNFKGLFVLGRGGNSKISKINKLQIKIPSIVSASALGAASYILDGSGGFPWCRGLAANDLLSVQASIPVTR